MLIADEKLHPGMLVVMIVAFSAFSVFCIVVSELSRHFSPYLPLACYFILFCGGVYIILTFLLATDKKVVRFIALGGTELMIAMLLVVVIASTVVFGLFCRELYFELEGGFAGNIDADFVLWVGFGFDNLFEAIFLDAPAIYGLNFADIEPATFTAQTLVFCFRAIVSLLVLKAIIRYWGFIRDFLSARAIRSARQTKL